MLYSVYNLCWEPRNEMVIAYQHQTSMFAHSHFICYEKKCKYNDSKYSSLNSSTLNVSGLNGRILKQQCTYVELVRDGKFQGSAYRVWHDWPADRDHLDTTYGLWEQHTWSRLTPTYVHFSPIVITYTAAVTTELNKHSFVVSYLYSTVIIKTYDNF